MVYVNFIGISNCNNVILSYHVNLTMCTYVSSLMIITVLIFIFSQFPHTNLYCDQYIDASTVVYVDNDVFNYTELNSVLQNVILMFDDLSIKTPCRWQVPYMICQSIYPQGDNRTQTVMSAWCS